MSSAGLEPRSSSRAGGESEETPESFKSGKQCNSVLGENGGRPQAKGFVLICLYLKTKGREKGTISRGLRTMKSGRQG